MTAPQTLDEGNFEPKLRTKIIENYDDLPNRDYIQMKNTTQRQEKQSHFIGLKITD